MKMFKTIRILGVLASAGAAYAADSHHIHANVPFAFVVAGQQFAPGAYNVTETSTGVLTVQGEGKAAVVISTPLDLSKPGDSSTLSFRNTNSRVYLSGVSIEGQGTRSVPVRVSAERNVALTR